MNKIIKNIKVIYSDKRVNRIECLLINFNKHKSILIGREGYSAYFKNVDISDLFKGIGKRLSLELGLWELNNNCFYQTIIIFGCKFAYCSSRPISNNLMVTLLDNNEEEYLLHNRDFSSLL